MDTTEVTMGQFKKFLKSSGYDKYSPTDEHPMVFVSWHEATAYCEWAGKITY